MIDFKGFSFPADIPLFFTSLTKVLKWKRLVRTRGFNNILSELDGIHINKTPGPAVETRLTKYHRIAYFYLTRIIRHKNPCIIASLSIFDICRGLNIPATLVVGADKENQSIEGHSWVETKDGPINERPETLNKYVRMVEI